MVFLGNRIPSYVSSSLNLATRYNNLDVELIGSVSSRFATKKTGASFISIQDFYDPQPFELAKPRMASNHDFRDGFWLRTLERFFVLEQFMSWKQEKDLLHVEADQLLFGAEELAKQLQKLPTKGLFFPLHSEGKAVASVFYCNDLTALRSLVQDATTGESFDNEMQLLLRWSQANPKCFGALPTLADIRPDQDNQVISSVISSSSIGGIVDAAELGLWVGGRDPRNLNWRIPPTNLYSYPPPRARMARSTLESLTFTLRLEPSGLEVRVGNSAPINLFNLHLHSKIHKWLAKDEKNLKYLFQRANQVSSFRVPGTRLTQSASWFVLAMRKPWQVVMLLWKRIVKSLRVSATT